MLQGRNKGCDNVKQNYFNFLLDFSFFTYYYMFIEREKSLSRRKDEYFLER